MTETYKLDNGLTIVHERLGHLRSAAVGVWIRAGSMLEAPEENGLSHLMEHMAFKGTPKRSLRELAERTDAIGGHLNAATGKLYTAYYARVTDADLPVAIDLISDIVRDPLLLNEELEKEKNVVLEEIAMGEDSAEDVADDLINEAVYFGQPLAMTVIGQRENIRSFTRDSLVRFRDRFYTPENTVVAVAGRFDKQHLKDTLEAFFGTWRGKGHLEYPLHTPNASRLDLFRDKAAEQVHCYIGFAGIPQDHPGLYALTALSSIFGGGVSSRLFQRIREEQGLVYNVYTSPSYYPTCGDFMVYAATSPRNVAKVMRQIDLERDRLLDEGVTEKELLHAKAQLKTSFVLSQENAYRRMADLGLNMLLRHRVVPAMKTLKRIEDIRVEDVNRLARTVLSGPGNRAFVGKKAEKYLRA